MKAPGQIPLANPEEMKKLAADGYKEVLAKPTLSVSGSGREQCQQWSGPRKTAVFQLSITEQGVFEKAEDIGGFAMEKIKVSNRGCPQCNMTCGNVVKDSEGKDSELDYENVVMLGSNIGLGNLAQVATLNRMADEFGLDAISLGNVIGFAMEASEKGLITEKIEWGDFEAD